MKQKNLTPRQSEFLAKSASGMTYEQIADEFVISVKTVTTTLYKARKRLDSKNNLQCLATAIWRKELSFSLDGTCYVSDKNI